MSLLSREPVRVYLYSVLTAVVALAVGTGIVTGGLAPLILGVGAAVLSVPAVEAARAKVTPVEKIKEQGFTLDEGREPSPVEREYYGEY